VSLSNSTYNFFSYKCYLKEADLRPRMVENKFPLRSLLDVTYFDFKLLVLIELPSFDLEVL